MVKSPVEGNSAVLLRLDEPAAFSDFARPACLPSSDEFVHMGAKCVTLGWTEKGEWILVDNDSPGKMHFLLLSFLNFHAST